MNESTSTVVASSRHVHIFLWLGVGTLALLVLLPLGLSQYVRHERSRLASCDRRERIDCDPSVIWLLIK